MLLGSQSALELDEAPGHGSETSDATHARLLGCVGAVFPSIVIASSRVERNGGDHLFLIVNEQYAFRFPRAGMHDLALELEVLKRLKGRTQLPTPFYEFVDPAGRFAGYRFIAGSELTPRRLDALSDAAQGSVLADAALFLLRLHALPRDPSEWSMEWPVAWTAADFAERGLTKRLPLIATRAPHLAADIEYFWKLYRCDRPDRAVILHGDLVPEHLLLDERTETLCGIIDFGDVALGDPAQDFMGFWAYGGASARLAVHAYSPGASDPGLLGRSRNHFIRYRLDRLFETLRGSRDTDSSGEIAEIELLLHAAPNPTVIVGENDG